MMYRIENLTVMVPLAGYSLLMASLSLHPLEHANSSLHQSLVDSESIEGRICTCENQTDLKTSRTNTNPATRFFICGQQVTPSFGAYVEPVLLKMLLQNPSFVLAGKSKW